LRQFHFMMERLGIGQWPVFSVHCLSQPFGKVPNRYPLVYNTGKYS